MDGCSKLQSKTDHRQALLCIGRGKRLCWLEVGVGVLLDDRAARSSLLGLSVRNNRYSYAGEKGIDIDLKRDLDILIRHNFWVARELYERLTQDS